MAFTAQEVPEFDQTSLKKKEPAGKRWGRTLLVILVTVITALIAAAVGGILVGLSTTAQVNGVQIVFDPQVTLAYLAVGFLAGYLYNLTLPQRRNLFLLSLFLSFTLELIQGALILVLLPPILKKLHLLAA